MKVFISADIEGVAGLTSWDDVRSSGRYYPEYVRQMEKEVDAACRGARNAGADEIIVKDAHDKGRNIDQRNLPEYVKILRGWSGSPYSMVGGLDSTFSAVLFIGYHDIAGSNGNPTAHTMNSSKIQSLTFNGNPVGEFHIHAYAAAYLDVPVVFLSGDQEICKRAQQVNSNIVTVATKKGVGNSTENYHPYLVEKQIEERVAHALEGSFDRYEIALPELFIVEVAYKQHFDAYKRAFYPGAKQVSPHSISFVADDYFEVLRFLSFVL
jgi:D-amino peptidase